MSFALDVKTEMCKIEIDDICCARAELAGMVCFGASVIGKAIKLRSEHGIVAQRFYMLIKHIYAIDIEVTLRDSGIFTAEITGDNVIKLLRDMRLATVPLRIDHEIIRKDCCKLAFLRGAFLGGGSVSNPAKGYHAEITTSHYTLGKDFSVLLENFDVFPKTINRNGNYVFYLKDSEQIENLLAALGAHRNMMVFLNVKIEKGVRNSANRMVNCETANVEKVVTAALAQRVAIEKVQERLGFESLPPELIEVAKLRLANPEASLAELAQILGISKSGVNHRMRKLMTLSKDL